MGRAPRAPAIRERIEERLFEIVLRIARRAQRQMLADQQCGFLAELTVEVFPELFEDDPAVERATVVVVGGRNVLTHEWRDWRPLDAFSRSRTRRRSRSSRASIAVIDGLERGGIEPCRWAHREWSMRLRMIDLRRRRASRPSEMAPGACRGHSRAPARGRGGSECARRR